MARERADPRGGLGERPARRAVVHLAGRGLIGVEGDGRAEPGEIRACDVRDHRRRTIGQSGRLFGSGRAGAIVGVEVGRRDGFGVRHAEGPIPCHDASGRRIDRPLEDARPRRTLGQSDGLGVASGRRHAHTKGRAARQVAVGHHDSDRRRAPVSSAVEADDPVRDRRREVVGDQREILVGSIRVSGHAVSGDGGGVDRDAGRARRPGREEDRFGVVAEIGRAAGLGNPEREVVSAVGRSADLDDEVEVVYVSVGKRRPRRIGPDQGDADLLGGVHDLTVECDRFT